MRALSESLIPWSLVSILACASPALCANAVEVTASSLNVRSGPGTQHAALARVTRGQVFASLRRQGEWHELQLDGRRGWSHGSYLRGSARALASVTAASLNVRSGPGTQHARLGALPRGSLVAPGATQGAWRQISFGAGSGWVHGSYLSPNAAVATPTTSAPTPASGAAEVTAASLNVRRGAGTQHAALGQALRGQAYALLSSSGTWRQIQFGAGAGWVHASYLKGSAAQVHHVTNTTSLNLRSGPGTGYRRLGTLPRGAALAVAQSSGSWRRVAFAGRDAWVHGSYLAPGLGAGTPPAPARPTSSVGYIQLAGSGAGFYSYTSSSKRWGRPELVYGIERVGRRWAPERRPRMGVGDLGYARGGRISPHLSHRKGEDVDVRPTMTYEGPGTIYLASYRRAWQQRMIDLYRAEMRIDLILFNDTRVRGVRSYSGHHNHFHARIH